MRYVQLAHNRRVEGTTQAQVLLNLGRQDRLDPDGLRRLVASINRYLGEPEAGGDVRELVGDALTVMGSRPMGTVHLLDGLWRQLGVDAALRQVLGARRFTIDVERVLFALVANRAVDPASKLAAAEWVREDVVVPGLASMDEDQAYRAMDLLVEADAQARVQEAVFFAVADLLNLEVDLLFFDTTSTYFERDTEETPTEQRPAGGLRRYGHSKDSRPDLPQIIIGLAVTGRGSRCAAGSGPATPPTSRCCLRSPAGCGVGGSVGSSRWWTAGSPPPPTWTTCAVPADTRSPGSGCVTATRPLRRRCPARPLPGCPGQPAGQTGPARRGCRRGRGALGRVPQPGRGRA